MAENNNKKINHQKKKRTSEKERKAFRFLCAMLSGIVIFVVAVCVFVDIKNDKLRAEGTTDITTTVSNETTQTQAGGNPPESTEEAQPSSEATSAQEQSAQPETAAASVVAPGTIDNPAIITIDEDKWHLTLVNTCYRIPDSYTPDLVYVCGSSERLDSKVAEHYEEMYNAAKADGVNLTPCSGYRSYERQENNYNNKIKFYESQGYSNADARVKAATIIMPPGSSEHNLGYAMDIVCVDEWFEDTAEFKWLTENAADYGFIMRYPKEKQDITKVIYEPWHWRYVGVEAAKEMKESGEVLEEYLGVV